MGHFKNCGTSRPRGMTSRHKKKSLPICEPIGHVNFMKRRDMVHSFLRIENLRVIDEHFLGVFFEDEHL